MPKLYPIVELAGIPFESPNQFSETYSRILNQWAEKGPISGADLQLVAALFDAHPEKDIKLNGHRAVGFISGPKDFKYHRNPTFRVVLDDEETVSFGISTVSANLWPKQ